MPNYSDDEIRKLSTLAKLRFDGDNHNSDSPQPQPITSTDYQQFKEDLRGGKQGLYEKSCNFCNNLFSLKLSEERKKNLQESINICHLNIKPEGAEAFAILFPAAIIILGATIAYAVFDSTFFAMFFAIMGIALIFPLRGVPDMLANGWRMKASNQMVQCAFYIVTYMRQNSNLEGAIIFASDHLTAPLSLDLKKVIWDVETGNYKTVEDSLEAYLETWRKWNPEFIESLHLIMSSLLETSEQRRLVLLDKSLDVILTETYEKMLHFAHNLKSPITVLHMMGVILPVLGLVILPLVVSFLGDLQWYHIAVLYNIVLPGCVFWFGKKLMSNRPSGYGDVDIGAMNPKLKKYYNVIWHFGKTEVKINPAIFGALIFIFFFIIAMIPMAVGVIQTRDKASTDKLVQEQPILLGLKFLDFHEASKTKGLIIGPFGIGAAVLSLCLTLALGLSFGYYFKLRSQNLIKIRQKTKELEKEFASALFQLGSRLGDGLPAEMAVGRVAEAMPGTMSGTFFEVVSNNVINLGMSVEDAIFDDKQGALLYFPSHVIDSSMRIMVESVRKGPSIAAEAVGNVSRYIKEIHRVEERLKDLMADVISSMKTQIDFMAPAISGIVVGITSMISTIMGKLGEQAKCLSKNSDQGGAQFGGVTEIFGDSIPTYYFQFVVGIYLVQIIYILTLMTNSIENGSDDLNERYMAGRNLIKSTILYVTISFVVMMLFNLIGMQVVGKASGQGCPTNAE